MEYPKVQTPVEELLSCYLTGRNPRTLEAYKIDLDQFKTFLGYSDLNEAVSHFVSLHPGQANSIVLRYRNTLLERGLQNSTINRRLASIRSLLKVARMIGIITWNIEIPNLKAEAYRDTRGPGLHVFMKMLNFAENQKEFKAKRDVAILCLLFDLALRASELTQLNVSDYDRLNSTLTILAKGKKNKIKLSLPERSCIALNDWLGISGQVNGPLFTNLTRSHNRDKRITRQGLYNIISKLGCLVGSKIRPHGIRHTSVTFACKIAQRNGLGIEDVLKHSRHQSLNTLQIYLDAEGETQKRIASLISVLCEEK